MAESKNRVAIVAVALVALLGASLLVARAVGTDDAPGPTKSPASADSPATPETSPSPTPRPLTPREAVKEAYLRQWEVYSRAVRTLRPRGLRQVLTGEALEVVRREVARLARKQTAVRVRVKHDIAIAIVDANTAAVDDRYVNHSVTIDPASGKPTERDPNELIHEVYTLKKVQGVWKVSAIVRQSVRPR